MFCGISLAPNFCYAFWPADWAMNAGLDTMLKTMKEAILRAAIAALKQEAARTINETVSNTISQGNGTGAMFVTNWENFLIKDPERKVDLYMNDFFSSLTQGRSSSSYSSSLKNIFGSASGSQKVAGASTIREGVVKAASSSSSFGGNYLSQLEQGARKLTTDSSIPICPETNFSSMFTSNNWNSTSTFFGVDTCNGPGTNQIVKGVYLTELSKQQKIAETQGVAYKGFLPATSGDTVITPGSTIEAIQAQTEDIGNKIIAGAQSIPEVITALVTRMAVKTIQQGIGQAGSYARREIGNKTSNYSQQIRNSTDPRQIFKPSY